MGLYRLALRTVRCPLAFRRELLVLDPRHNCLSIKHLPASQRHITKIFVDSTKPFVYQRVWMRATGKLKGCPMPRSRSEVRPARPTDGELDILRVLWDRGPSTVRQVHQMIVGRRQTTFNTTLKLLQIMFAKGLVTREDAHRPHIYQAAAPEAEVQRQLVSDLLQRAFGGAARKLVAALTTTNISDEEMAEIRRLLDERREKGDERTD